MDDERGDSEDTAIKIDDDDEDMEDVEETVMEDVPSVTLQHPGQALTETPVSGGTRVVNTDLVRVLAETRYGSNFVRELFRVVPDVMDKGIVFDIPAPMIAERVRGGVSYNPNPACRDGIKMWVAGELTEIAEAVYDNIFDLVETADDEYNMTVDMRWAIEPIARDQFTHVMCVTYSDEDSDDGDDEDDEDDGSKTE
jgi:hypothetical protein